MKGRSHLRKRAVSGLHECPKSGQQQPRYERQRKQTHAGWSLLLTSTS